MRTLGLRASPKGVIFAVYDTTAKEVINIEQILIPMAFATPEALKYTRNNILDVLREYQVTKAGIRIQEPISMRPNTARAQIEGVIQEAFASSDVDAFFAGPIAVIASKLAVERTRVKPMIEGENDLEIDGWDELTTERREAVLYALGAQNA